MTVMKYINIFCLLLIIYTTLATCTPISDDFERETRGGQKLIRFGRGGQKLIRFGRSSNPPGPPSDIEGEEGVVYEDIDPGFFFNEYNPYKRGGQKLIRFGRK
uniref:Uncharacterized protein n=1 Tax=Parastrongyloides trichosuri TaxID=131310 RepID=A0A0N4ZK50_PARTI